MGQALTGCPFHGQAIHRTVFCPGYIIVAVSRYRVGVYPMASHFLSHLCHFACSFFNFLPT